MTTLDHLQIRDRRTWPVVVGVFLAIALAPVGFFFCLWFGLEAWRNGDRFRTWLFFGLAVLAVVIIVMFVVLGTITNVSGIQHTSPVT